MKTLINQYFKFIFPLLILALLARETAILIATADEHYLEDVSFFAPARIKNNSKKAGFADQLLTYISNRKLVHVRYKTCAQTLNRYRVFDPQKTAEQTQKCIQILNDALKAAPSSPLIWLELAALYAQQQDAAAQMNQSLLNAWQIAKYQAWVGQRRIVFSLGNWAQLSGANKAHAKADFMHFSPNNRSVIKSLAQQFAQNPTVKPIATAWIADSSTKTQKQFIDYVRAAQ
ncbi:MAG: hypothetical protein COC24_019195 [Alphaproteobacteria bacterium]|nr:hypothetical protein [Alphaproteobacteria bacterium]